MHNKITNNGIKATLSVSAETASQPVQTTSKTKKTVSQDLQIELENEFETMLENIIMIYAEWNMQALNIEIVNNIDTDAEQALIALLEKRVDEYLGLEEHPETDWDEVIQSMPSTDIAKNYLNQINQIKQFTQNEEKQITEEYKTTRNPKLREEITNRNLRLVVSIAKKYTHPNMDFMDIIQEGNLGLLKAIEKFNPDLGYKFSTYATCWIKQGISRSITNTGNTIKISADITKKYKQIRKAQDQHLNEFNKEATDEELAKKLNIATKSVKAVKRAMLMQQNPTSLDDIKTENGPTLKDMLKTSSENLPEKRFEAKDLGTDLAKALSHLKPREQSILTRVFGFNKSQPETLTAIAKDMGLTKTRVHQIKEAALKKLRNNKTVAEQLEIYLKDW
jgi:RNA polymerase sigma factor (sigma-70 family)